MAAEALALPVFEFPSATGLSVALLETQGERAIDEEAF